MSKRGFDPDRLQQPEREQPIIPQMLAPDNAQLAKGFTEIKVVGIGGAGNNTIDRMIETGVQGIDFIAVNTDVQALHGTLARKRVQLGSRLTRGLGTGGDPKIGERAASEAKDALYEALTGADMAFITAGLGGGTGTGAAPVAAMVAQDVGALTVGIVTLPFSFEGSPRRTAALEGLQQLRPHVDALIVIANDKLLQITPDRIGIADAFKLADQTLNQGIHGMADLIITPGVINLDFADVRSVMQRAGRALMAVGTASGEDRALRAADAALNNPLLEASIDGAQGILLNIMGDANLTLYEINQAAERVAAVAGPDCNFIFGAAIHAKLLNEIRVTVIATGYGRD